MNELELVEENDSQSCVSPSLLHLIIQNFFPHSSSSHLWACVRACIRLGNVMFSAPYTYVHIQYAHARAEGEMCVCACAPAPARKRTHAHPGQSC